MRETVFRRWAWTGELQQSVVLPTIAIAVLTIIIVVFLLHWNPVAAVGIAVALLPIGYLVARPTYASAVQLMILTLPFLSAFVIYIGGDLRIPYIFAAAALCLGLYQGKLRAPPATLPILLLTGFVLYAVFSTALVFQFDFPLEVIPSGFHTSKFRPLIQSAQLFLMVSFFFLTFNYLTDARRLRLVVSLIFWSLVMVVAYGTYEVICALSGCEFFNLKTDKQELRFAGNQMIPFGQVLLPRVSSLLAEPINHGVYLLFSIPFAIARLWQVNTRSALWFNLIILAFAFVMFMFTWSRAALLGGIVVLPLVLLLVRGWRTRLILVGGGVFVYLSVAAVLLPTLGASVGVASPIVLLYNRLQSVAALPASLGAEENVRIAASRQVGRQYYLPIEIIKKHPIWGVGLGNYPVAAADLMDGPLVNLSAFSLQLELLTQLGLIGFSLYFGLIGYILLALYRAILRNKRHPLRPVAIASILSIVGVMVASAGLGGLTTASHIWVMLAIGAVIPALMRVTTPNPGPIGDESPG